MFDVEMRVMLTITLSKVILCCFFKTNQVKKKTDRLLIIEIKGFSDFGKK
jgi:hypothetical protein